MRGLIGIALIAGAAGATEPRVLKLATLELQQSGLGAERASVFTEHLATRLGNADDVRVTSPSDVAAVLGMERQRQLLGCDDSGTSCVAGLAGALGVDALVSGQVAKVGEKIQLNLKVIAAENGRRLFSHSSDLLDGDEGVIKELNRIAEKIVPKVRDELDRMRAPVEAQPAGPAMAVLGGERGGGRSKLVVAGVGGAIALAGGAMLLVAKLDYDRLTNRSLWDEFARTGEAERLRERGELLLPLGLIVVGVGATVLLTSLILLLVGS